MSFGFVVLGGFQLAKLNGNYAMLALGMQLNILLLVFVLN